VSERQATRKSPDEAYEIGVRLVAIRAHSEAELRRKLLRRGCEPDDVDGAMVRMRSRGYLDDEAYARSLVRRRSVARGPALIAAELAAKGVDRETTSAALSELDRDGQLAAARRLAAALSGLAPARLSARLQRRGFEAAVVRRVLSEQAGRDECPLAGVQR
jgi:regulatory protein